MHNYRKYDGFFGSFRPIFKHRNLVINDPIEFVEMAQWHKSNIQNMCNSSNILLLLLCFFPFFVLIRAGVYWFVGVWLLL